MIFTPIGPQANLSQQVATQIEKLIGSQTLVSGSRLPSEAELASQFNVSRITIREAIKILSARNVVQVFKGKGIFVQGIDEEHVIAPLESFLRYKKGNIQIIHLIEARMIIEPSITAAAARYRSAEDLHEMKCDIEKMKDFHGTAEEFANLDMGFHMHIAAASHNDLITLILKPIYRLMPKLKKQIVDRVSDATVAAIIWHEKIFKAIEAGDEVAALAMMQEHLRIAKEHALQVTTPN